MITTAFISLALQVFGSVVLAVEGKHGPGRRLLHMVVGGAATVGAIGLWPLVFGA